MISWSFGKQQHTEKTESEKSFLSMASHELRTPLSVIKWYTEMLLDGDGGDLTDEQAKYLKVIQSSNQRAIDLIRSLLDVSRLDLGTYSIIPSAVVFRPLIEQVFSENKTKITEKNITVLLDEHGDNLSVTTDKQMCYVILRNLITNALIFGHKGTSVTVRLETIVGGTTTNEVMYPTDGVLVTVSDHGIGIPDDDKDKIFSKLFKAKNTGDGEQDGSGLGLYIVKSAVTALNGMVWFHSSQDGDTTFYVFFPKNGVDKKDGTTVLE